MEHNKQQFVVIRLKSTISQSNGVYDTLRMLDLRTIHTLVVVPNTPSVLGMIKKIEHCITWGELSSETEQLLGGKTIMHLKPPLQGFKSKIHAYPKGDLGYRGAHINELVKKMMK